MLEAARDRLSEVVDRSVELSREHPWLATGLGISALLGGYLLTPSKGEYRKKPDTGSLTGGGIDRDEVKSVYNDYYDAYGKEAGAGITDRSRTTGDPFIMVNASCLQLTAILIKLMSITRLADNSKQAALPLALMHGPHES